MDEYQYPLFFEAKDLTDRDKEKIKRHFQKRRDSGGGECGMIEEMGDNTYKICFKKKEDQERVLQRKFQIISLPSGELRLTMSRTCLPQRSDQPSAPTLTKTNANGFEKIFKMDIYLLYYMKDNNKLNQILQKQLSAIGCSLKLDFDKEEAVVRGDIEKAPGRGFRAAEKWEIQVDRVFIGLTDSYVCHHVLDPKQIRAIQQDPSFATEDIRVYGKTFYSVVVGEVGAVKERIANLEKSLPIYKNIPVVEKKFELIEEDFTRDLRTSYPEVKATVGKGMIVLEGPSRRVQSAAEKLDELLKKIVEKRITLPIELLTFMLFCGAIHKYQTRFRKSLRNPVSLGIGSDLVLSSLSSGDLDQAEAEIMRDLKVDTVQLQGFAAVPPDLDRVKDILTKAKHDANCREIRVDFSLIPEMNGTKVQIVGYSKHVNKMREVLHDFQVNNVRTEDIVNLSPKLVDCIDKVLDLIQVTQSEVTLKASHFPHPCVLVSGPRCLVLVAKTNLEAALANLTSDTLVLDGSGAQRYFQAEGKTNLELVESAFKVIIREQQGANSQHQRTKPQSVSSPDIISLLLKSSQVAQTTLEIKLGSLEDQQVNVLVVPMLNKKLTSTEIGKCLLGKAGTMITINFDLKAARCYLSPGDVLQVDAPSYVGFSKIFFIECLPWDGVRGQSVQALGKGLRTCLDLCVQQGWCSIAFPIIGPGLVLEYPPREAVQVLTENIQQFGSSPSAGSLSNIYIVIKPDYANAEESYHELHRLLSLNSTQHGRVIFRSVTSDLDEVTMTVAGGVKLQLVFGDITNETTDAIVNSTDFVHFHDANVNQEDVFVTHPGSLSCEVILHVHGRGDPGVIKQRMCDIIDHCETFGLKSVAIPAICAGTGGMDPSAVAEAILQGINTSTMSAPPLSLTVIRIVLNKINVFLAFKEKATRMFPTAMNNRVSALQLPYIHLQQRPTLANTDLSIHTSLRNQQSTFLFLGLSRENVSTAMTKLKDLYQAQCSTETFTKEQLEVLTQDDINDLQQLVETQGLYMQRDQSGQGSLTVTGLKDGVTQVLQMVIRFQQSSFIRKVRVRDEEDLYNRVAWCILGHNGNWKRLPKEANYDLENNETAAGIVDTHGISWIADLQKMEATRRQTGQTAKLKRLENRPDFTLPLYWDNMTINETMKVVCLQSSSTEYQTVIKAFQHTVHKTVIKVERVQNIHLRQAYETQKKQISDKNSQQVGAGLKLLYHGTSRENSISIMKTGFNRSFAGQNAKNLTDRDQEMIKRYLQKRRKSGGRDSGMTETTGENTYKMSFKEKEDQKRVLQRDVHTIKLPNSDLCLSVRQTISTQVPNEPSTQTVVKINKKGQKKIFKIETYLMYYLRDNPKAYNILQKQLSAIDCSVELDFDEEEVVVRGNIEKGPGRGFKTAEKWEIQVNQVLKGFTDSYVCHHVLDPKQNRVLQQDPFFATKDVTVYIEAGYSVVVGDVGAVNERIAILKNSMPIDINNVTEVLNDFQLNHVETQERMNLSPGLVQCFDKVLDLIGSSHSGVTIKPSHSPHPCLLLSGPRCLVKEAQTNLTASLANLISDTLVLDGSGAQRYFQEEGKMNKELVESACKVIIREQQQLTSLNVTTKPQRNSNTSTWSLTPKSTQVPLINLEIKIGNLEDEQVNVLVVPMLNKKLTSTKIGNSLLSKAGTMITRNFDLKAATCSLSPGDVLQVDAPPSLGCPKIFFIECLPWDGVRGQSVQALGKGLRTCFDLCVQQGQCSIAFPVIGPGLVLKYPPREAIQVLTENIRLFGSSASDGSLSNIHVVIKPGYANAEECYHEVFRGLSVILTQIDQVIFRSVTSDLDEVTMTVAGGVKLQLIFGDITNEKTDVIVNSTDFGDFKYDGVCKKIIAVAGPEIEAKLKEAKVNQGEIFVTKSGALPCKYILHVHGKSDAGLIEQLASKIIQHCEILQLKSVAIPAICAGIGGLDPGVVAGAILQGIKSDASSTSLSFLTDIHLVLFKINDFLSFKKKAMQMFPTTIFSRVSASQLPSSQQQQKAMEASTDQSVFDTTSKNPHQSNFLFLGLSRENVSTAMTKLKDLYQAQCSTETFTNEQLEVLTKDDMNDLQQLVETQGLYMERDQSGQGSLTVRGLKDGVSQVMQMMNRFKESSFLREVRVRDEEDLYNRVAWCILGHNRNWERLPKKANYDLDNNETAAGIVDTQGSSWSIDLQKMQATKQQTGQRAKLKRLENRPDFTLPLYWDNMTISDTMKVVCLQSSSAEYQTVMKAFLRTVTKTVMKIERVQNVHLRRAYEALKMQISDKNNQQGGAGEKLLYHGTSQGNCKSIMKTGFNRSFAGQNATSYGHGTYFAVNANYSAQPTYSRPAADGSQLVFVARVLTGTYTLGSGHMKVPPPRNNQQPHDRYDSLVDVLYNPRMFIVFHDSQAYPDYLITFK